jgi:hypothetical protein
MEMIFIPIRTVQGDRHMADDFTFEITQNLGAISEGKGGWNLELNMVSWGGRPAKYDIRSWSPDHQKMGKGLTLTKEELVSLRKTLDTLNIE